MRHARLISAVPTAALLLALGASVGCSSTSNSNHAGDIEMLRSDPSPAMHTLGERADDRQNRYVSVKDSNFRMISDDWDRLWYIDRPSHLTKYPKIR